MSAGRDWLYCCFYQTKKPNIFCKRTGHDGQISAVASLARQHVGWVERKRYPSRGGLRARRPPYCEPRRSNPWSEQRAKGGLLRRNSLLAITRIVAARRMVTL